MGKHILVISQYFFPEQFRINDICTEWIKRGYKVTVITGIPNYPEGKYYSGYGLFRKRKETYNGVDIIRIPLIPRGKRKIMLGLNYLSFVISGFFWKTFTRIKADLVFIFEVSPMTQALPGVWYAKRRKIPCYIYVQDLWPENVEIAAGIKNKRILRMIGKMVDYIYAKCNRIFVTSPSFGQSIQSRGVNENKIVFWPQYAEEFYQYSSERSELIPCDGVMNITFTGNIGTAQGLEILPETAAELKRKNMKVRFNIVGDGRSKTNLVNQIKEKCVDEYFNIIGWQSANHIPVILASSDVAFLSFANEPLYSMTIPAKLQSYMACRIPIIGSVSGESKQIISDAECGLSCNIGDANALAELIIAFANLSEQEKSQMAINAQDYVKHHFDKKSLLDFMDECFIEVNNG